MKKNKEYEAKMAELEESHKKLQEQECADRDELAKLREAKPGVGEEEQRV